MWAQTWTNIWDIVRPDEFEDTTVFRRRIFENMTVMDMAKR